MINAIGSKLNLDTLAPVSQPRQSPFVEALKGAVDRVELSQQTAAKSAEAFLNGETEDIHAVGMAAQRAELEFDLALQVRNKVVQAYQEILRMPL
jgi:flagellar hook-basal body complex protein FliE